MSNPEIIDFLRERRSHRPDEQAPVEQELRPAPVQQERPAPEAKREHKPEKKGPRCSCCGLPGEKVRIFLDMGRGVLLCDRCIQVCNEILSEEDVTTDAIPEQATVTPRFSHSSRTRYYCSFCGKEQEHIVRLVAMLNSLFICNLCIGRCNAGIAQALADAPTEADKAVEPAERT